MRRRNTPRVDPELFRYIGLIVLLAVILVPLIVWWKRDVEKYGGPVKRIRNIPASECETVCRGHYHNMISSGRADEAATRYRNCIAECKYSDFHRL